MGRAYRGTPLLSPGDRHLVSRFSYGVTPELAARVRKAGGARRWWQAELNAGTADPGAGQIDGWWPDLDDDPGRLWINSRARGSDRTGYKVMIDYQRWCLARRIVADRQPREVMTEFWENLFNVPTLGDPSFVQRFDYGQTIRRNAFASYETILTAAVTHPAMLLYLDQCSSTKEHPIENLGRELLELHTVGRGAYDESEVVASARILTGWLVRTAFKTSDMASWDRYYDPAEHWTGTVRVMGFSDANRDPRDTGLLGRYLRYLARHERTALRVAQRLAVKFVSDTPSRRLVENLARVYLANDTEIVPVLEALVSDREFQGAVGRKVRDPGEDIVATHRALGSRMSKPRTDDDAAQVTLYQSSLMGQTPFSWPRPDGSPIDNASWSTPARMLGSFKVHHNLAHGAWPNRGVTYRSASSWLPPLPARFSQVVDHLSRQILHRPASDRLIRACAAATGQQPGETVTSGHPVAHAQLDLVLTTILDSPEHLAR